MKKLLMLILSVLIGTSGFAQTEDWKPKKLERKIDNYIQPLVDNNDFSGSILIAKGNKILFSKAYGLANREHNVENTENSIYRIGSITKQFTAAGIMLLEQEGKLSVDDPLSKYIPDYPDGDKITIHHLLTHTSGIVSYTHLSDFKERLGEKTTLLELIDRVKYLPLEFEPGSQFRYNDSGYLLLTYIIEQVSGLSYPEFMKANIFDPLEMTHTGYAHNNTIVEGLSQGYVPGKMSKRIENADYHDMSIAQGAGNLYSTTHDLYKWDRSFYNNTILTPETQKKIFTFYIADYGYGWGREIRKNDRLSIGHNGIINGYTSIIHRFVNDDVVIIVLANMENYMSGNVFNEIPAIYFREHEE